MQAPLTIENTNKDEIIKRQALEISCLSSIISDQSGYVEELVQERLANSLQEFQLNHVDQLVQEKTASLRREIQILSDNNAKLQEISRNALSSMHLFFNDYTERLKFVTAMGIVDEAWYQAEYPDVAQDYDNAGVKHFCEYGIFEGRKPNGLMSF